jgi:TolA-binding protein
LLGGCASVTDVAGVATQQDLLQLRTDVTIAQQRAQRASSEAEAALAASQRRDTERDAEVNRRLAELAQRVDGLATSVATLSTQIDELSGRLEALARRPRAATPPPATPPPATPAPPPPVTAAPTPAPRPAPVAAAPPVPAAPAPGSRPTTNALQPQDIYQTAYLDFSKGSYALAIAGFREFLRRFPDQPLAGAAQYWIGEAHFSLARGYANAGQAPQATEALEQAVQEFRKVLAGYPRSDKAPASVYKEALVLLELKQPAVAEQRLQYLVDTFPQAEESALARERLAALRPR